jgi:hypothetical protein
VLSPFSPPTQSCSCFVWKEGRREGRREVMIYSVARTDKSKHRLAEHRTPNAELRDKKLIDLDLDLDIDKAVDSII